VTAADNSLVISAALFTTLIDELAHRGDGQRESGAFLLASRAPALGAVTSGRWQTVVAVAYYDDLDPACLTGGITFSANGYTALAAVCRRDGMRAVGDIHTHPGNLVGQSPIDAAYPMVALPGHIALIAPSYARGPVEAADLGAHVFNGAGQWTSRFGDDVTEVLRIGPPVLPAAVTVRRSPMRALSQRLRRLITPWKLR